MGIQKQARVLLSRQRQRQVQRQSSLLTRAIAQINSSSIGIVPEQGDNPELT